MIISKMNEIEESLAEFAGLIEHEITQLKLGKHPKELYNPIEYILQLEGKRLRPALTLLSYNLYKTDCAEIAKYALAVEVFHNFTLMHDDIMDQAPLRRGKATVHEKWDNNVAILSGDVMLVKAYELFFDLDPSKLPSVLKSFSICAAEVCEGQQIDMNFEKESVVEESAYIEMIRLKTAVLLGFALELGAMLADAAPEDQNLLKLFGENIGIGFQLKDDLLDVYADKAKFGKQIGGDIIANKKTFLLIKALELSQGRDVEQLQHWLQVKNFDTTEKVEAVKKIYDELEIKALTIKKIDFYFQKGFDALKALNLPAEKKARLNAFAEKLINREK